MLTIGYNTTDISIIVDESGFSIPGRDWGVVDTLDPVGKAELDSGRLVKAKVASLAAAAADQGHPRAAEFAQVLEALEDRKQRREAAQALDKDELLTVVDDPDQLPVGGDGKPSKADLVDEAVAEATADNTDVVPPAADVPETPQKKTTSRSAAKK